MCRKIGEINASVSAATKYPFPARYPLPRKITSRTPRMTSQNAPDLSAKRLDILHTLAPSISRFAILWDSSNPGMAARVRETKIAADQSRILLQTVGPTNLDELD